MSMQRIALITALFALGLAAPALAADVQGSITDRSGGVLPGVVVRLLNVATGQQVSTTVDATGHFRFSNLKVGSYRIATSQIGFSDASRTVIVTDESQSLTVDFELELGSVKAEVTVSAARGERDADVVPLRTDTIGADAVREMAPVSTGDALAAAPGVTLVGSGPFQVRPRLRGLDSTRVLILVDGERLNNARTATERAGVEVGLVDVASIDSIEVLGGAGSVLYGTDALSGTINILTNRARVTDVRQMVAGFDGYYSSNENGRRGTVTLGMSDTRWAISFKGGVERFDNYKAGSPFAESSQSFFDAGTIRRLDTIDSNFPGFTFRKFPDPFNAPFTRTSQDVPNSGMEGSSVNVSGVAVLSASQTLDVKYQHRRAENVGFPDFAEPFFFQGITLPWSQFDKISATYAITNVTSWMPRLTIAPYYQRQDRLLRNTLPAQFPVPSPQFFPISVRRSNIVSDTRQQVWTPGIDVQATLLTHPTNVITVGTTIFRDRSADDRTTTTDRTEIGQVAMGPFGPAAVVYPTPVALGSAVEHPVRVPNASFSDVGVFVQDEWTVSPIVRLTAGLRADGYRVVTLATPGYDVETLIAGAAPAIARSTLPNVNGDRIKRTAVTGEAGTVLWADRAVNAFAHYVRSYRHPNLEELLFSGPATTGAIVPNIEARPETGHNVDVGTRLRSAHLNGSLSYFNNTYRNFISTEIVATVTSQSGVAPISQAINLARVRIQGVEAEGSTPFGAANLSWLPYGAVSFNRGTVLAGASPLSGTSLAGAPQDNITPWKTTVGLRVNDRRERWWAGYSVRTEAEVSRVSPLLTDSPFLIPQDLLGLGGFSVHRLATGFDWRRNDQRLALTFAVDNLTDEFYREQFQFAPARGRSFTVTLSVRGVQ